MGKYMSNMLERESERVLLRMVTKLEIAQEGDI